MKDESTENQKKQGAGHEETGSNKEKEQQSKAEELGGDLGVTDGITGPTGQAGNLGSVEMGSGELGGKGTDR